MSLNNSQSANRVYLGVAGTPPTPHNPSRPGCGPRMPQGSIRICSPVGISTLAFEAHGSSPACQNPEEGEQGDVRPQSCVREASY